jgi:RNA polymerase sigma-70 factor (ECF subfamily)
MTINLGARIRFSDEELIRSAIDPTQEALRHLYEKYDPYLSRFIPSFLRVKGCHSADRHADGVRSQTWISVLTKLEDLRNPDSFRAWITVIATNAARKHLRECIRAQVSFESSESDYTGDAARADKAAIKSEQSIIEAAIDAAKVFEVAYQISSDFAEILYLRFWEELDFHEIAQVLGMPHSNVRTIYYRNRAKVNDVLSRQTSPNISRPSPCR